MAAEEANLGIAHTGMAQEFAAAAARRTQGADALAENSRYAWTINMQSPSVMTAHGMRIAAEAGSGRTRAESNAPAATSAGQ